MSLYKCCNYLIFKKSHKTTQSDFEVLYCCIISHCESVKVNEVTKKVTISGAITPNRANSLL